MIRIQAILGTSLFLICQLSAQFRPITYNKPGTVYTQTFDSLPASGTFTFSGKGPFDFTNPPLQSCRIPGWFFLQPAGSSPQASFYVGSGTSASHGVVSAGISSQPDRSLGTISTSGGAYAFGLILVNQTGTVLNSLSVAALIEQWRKGGSGRKNNWLLKVKTGRWQGIDTVGWIAYPAGNFTSRHFTGGASSLNGNLAENQQPLSFQLDHLTWKPDEQLLLCWFDPDEAGNDDLCALDMFQLSATRQSRLAVVDSILIDTISPQHAILSAKVYPGGSKTEITWEWDTIPSFDFPKSGVAVPNEVNEWIENQITKVQLTGLQPEKKYWTRLIATNEVGSTISHASIFTTPPYPPEVSIINHRVIAVNQVELDVRIQNPGTNTLPKFGIQWSKSPDFTGAVSIPANVSKKDTLQVNLSNLVPASRLYARGFIEQNNVFMTGNRYSFFTPTTVSKFQLSNPHNAKDSFVLFQLQLAHPIEQLAREDFELITAGISDAKITAIEGSGTSFTITVYTGKGDGTIRLVFRGLTKNPFPVFGTPVMAIGTANVDRTPPLIKRISIPNQLFKVADTLVLSVSTEPDTSFIDLIRGSIAGLPLQHWQKLNDSTYLSRLTLPVGDLHIPASDGIHIGLTLSDAAGNQNTKTDFIIDQTADEIDTKLPFISSAHPPADKLKGIGDTLFWHFRFSEKIMLSTTDKRPYLWINIGGNNRQAPMIKSEDNFLSFGYIVKEGESDMDGITWRNVLTLNGSRITDVAGNPASLEFTNTSPSVPIKVDGLPPSIESIALPAAGMYKLNEELLFRFNFSEKIRLIGKSDSIQLLLQLESNAAMAALSKIADSSLEFKYRVQPGDWDKRGIIPVGIFLKSGSQIVDEAGNKATVKWKIPLHQSSIFIDAMAPVFSLPHDTIILSCTSDTTLVFSGIADFSDKEPREKITIQPGFYSGTGKIILDPGNPISNGAAMPVKLFVIRAGEIKQKRDSLQLILSDGIHFTSKWIYLENISPIQNNHIEIPAIQCLGEPLKEIKGSTPIGGTGTFTYQWESAAGPEMTFSKTAEKDSIKKLFPKSFSDSVWLRRWVRSGPCMNYSPIVILPIMGKGLWRGKTSGDWNNSDNWCLQTIPLSDRSVVIPGGVLFSPTIRTTGFCQHLEIRDSGKLEVTGILQIEGEIKGNPGSLMAEKGTLIVAGNQTRRISGTLFSNRTLGNLIVRNKMGISIKDSLEIQNELTLQSGDLMIRDLLTMHKGSSIGASAEGTSIKGIIKVYYPVPGKKRQYQLTSHPFAHTIPLQALINYIDITGNPLSDSLFSASPLQLPSAFKLAGSTSEIGGEKLSWIPVTSLQETGANGWKTKEGIAWLLRGKKGEGLDDETDWLQSDQQIKEEIVIPLKGFINTGDQEIKLADTTQGLRIMGNPFLSAINPAYLNLSDSIAPFYWKWNLTQGVSGGFTCHPFHENNIIPAFGSILIHIRGNTNEKSIIVPEKAKIRHANLSVMDENDTAQKLMLDWFLDSLFIDQITLRQNQRAESGFDVYDGIKIKNPSHNFFLTTYDQQFLSYDQRPFHIDSRFQLGIQDASIGKYLLRVKRLNWRNEYGWQLADNFTGKYYPLSQDTTIDFQVTPDTLSQGKNRFSIFTPKSFSPQSNYILRPLLRIWPVPAGEKIHVGCMVWPKEEIDISIFNQLGQLVKSLKLPPPLQNNIEIKVADLPKGIYQLIIINSNQYFQAMGRWVKH
ncbi:MAG: T9SS type A sorting domain-containing protein [Bacteroidota bacterium]